MRTTVKLGAALALAVAAWGASAADAAVSSDLASMREMPQQSSPPAPSIPAWTQDMRTSPCWAIASYTAPAGESYDNAFNVLGVQRYRISPMYGRDYRGWHQLVAMLGDSTELTLARAATREKLFPVLAYYMERTADCEGRQPQRPGYYLGKPAAASQPDDK